MAVDEADKLIKDELFQDLLVVLKDRIVSNIKLWKLLKILKFLASWRRSCSF